MERVSTCLMFVGDQHGRAQEALDLYLTAFENAHAGTVEHFAPDDPQQGIKRGPFELGGQRFWVMDGGLSHDFTMTPAVSVFVELDDEAQLTAAFALLAEGGSALMPLDDYGFSRLFGWVQDRFGVSWQLKLV